MRLAISEDICNLSRAYWLRWALLVSLLLLGTIYVIAFTLFVTESKDFIVDRRNRDAAAFALAHRVTIPASILLRSDAPFIGILGGGWHPPELQGVWSSAKDSWIELTVPAHSPNAILRLDTTFFLAESQPKTKVAVEINGQASGKWERNHTNAAEPIEIHLSEDALKNGRLTVHLHVEHVASPFSRHAGPDLRPLGFLLSSLTIAIAP